MGLIPLIGNAVEQGAKKLIPKVGQTLLDVAAPVMKPLANAVGMDFEKKAFGAEVKGMATRSVDSLATMYNRLTQSGGSFLEKAGGTSAKLGGLVTQVGNDTKEIAGKYAMRWDNIVDQNFPKGASNADLEHISDVAEGLVKAKTQAHQNAADGWAGLMDEFSDQAHDLGLKEQVGGVWHKVYNDAKGQTVTDPATGAVRQRTDAEARAMATKAASQPFSPREFYVPHYYTRAAIRAFIDDPQKMQDAMDIVIKRGYASTRADAEKVVKMYLAQPAEFRGGPLQHSRELDQFIQGGYDKNLNNVAARYFYTATKRLQTAKVFGANDELATHTLIPQIAAEGGNARVANNLYVAFADTANPEFRDLARLASSIHSITLLSTAGIVQPSQLSNIAARVGWTKTLRSMCQTITDWKGSEKWARHTGATLDSISADTSIDSPTALTHFWSRLIGLEQLDKYNRVVAAVAGRLHATSLADELAHGGLRGVVLEKNLRMLDKLGIDPAAVIAQNGQLTMDQLRRAGYRLSKNTQFASEVLDMPEYRTQPLGRFLFLFKSFAFQQAKFLKEEVLKEAFVHGNMEPTLNYIAGAAALSSIIAPTVRAIKGRPTPTTMEAKFMEDAGTAGMFGMYWDGARALWHGPGSVVNWMLGPTASEALQFGTSDVAGIGRGIARGEGPDFQPLLKHVVRRAPLVGQYVANTWWPQP